MMYSSPNVVQYRNEHSLIDDFKSEYEMYLHNEKILDFIGNNMEAYDVNSKKELLTIIFHKLLENNVITSLDIDILNKWNSYF